MLNYLNVPIKKQRLSDWIKKARPSSNKNTRQVGSKIMEDIPC